MRELKNKKITIMVSFLLILLFIYYMAVFASSGFYANSINKGADIYYDTVMFLPFYILVAFLANNLVVNNFYENKYSKFQNFIVTRTGRKKRLIYEIVNVLISSFLFRIIVHIFMLVVIHLFFSNIEFTIHTDLSYYRSAFISLNTNPYVSLLIYIIYSSVGFSIFSLFVYSMISFIKNKYVYKVSGIISFILLIVIGAFLGNELYKYFDNIKFFNPVIQAFNTFNLISPGVEGFTSVTTLFEAHVYYWYTCVMFLIYWCIF